MRAAATSKAGLSGIRRVDVDAQPELGRRQRDHAAELAAAEDAEGRAGRIIDGHDLVGRALGDGGALARAPGVEPLRPDPAS